MDVAFAESDDRWVDLSEGYTPSGDRIVLRRRAGQYEIRLNGWELMTSRSHHSEDALAALACDHMRSASPRVLVGGLGMGFTLRALLDRLPASAHVTVAELLPEVMCWNRGPLGQLASYPLRDPRVAVRTSDVASVLHQSHHAFDAVVLDVDNGPEAVMVRGNRHLYQVHGLRRIRSALRPAGVLAVWSAEASARFPANLAAAGYDWCSESIPARGAPGDPEHVIYLATPRRMAALPGRVGQA